MQARAVGDLIENGALSLLNGLQAAAAAAATDINKRNSPIIMTNTKMVIAFSRMLLKLVQPRKT